MLMALSFLYTRKITLMGKYFDIMYYCNNNCRVSIRKCKGVVFKNKLYIHEKVLFPVKAF